MKMISSLLDFWNEKVLGLAVNVAQKRKAKQRIKSNAKKGINFLAPQLEVSFKSKMMVASHILKGHRANEKGKVAWVTSGAPVEVLKAMDF